MKLTQEKIDLIKSMYLNDKMSYIEITKVTGICSQTLCKYLTGLRTHSEAMVLSKSQGKRNMSEQGRRNVSDSAKLRCQKKERQSVD